jgi:putative ATP-dependent endonuclease of OLD family
MYLTKLELFNFRGFEHEIIELDDITVFVGENNTGKTSIMDAIKLIIGTPSWQEGLSRFDYRLGSSKANPGDAGEIIIKIEMSEKKEDEWPDEIQQTIPDVIDYDEKGIRHIYLTLKGTYDQSISKSIITKEFTNNNGETKGSKANNNQSFNHLKTLLPIFQINSIRDFEAEFQQKRGIFRKFLNSDNINIEEKNKFENKLNTLNKEIIDILKNIKLLKTNLSKSMSILSGTDEAIIDIESIPTNLDSLIEKAGVVLQNTTGIRLPLERHGSGALSLAVIFLYEAYLSVLIEDEFDKFSTPILLIEEPEAHLHPSAVRLFWNFLEKMPGQKIISTHSGDIISKIPISKIRRIIGSKGLDRVKKINESKFDITEKRFLKTYISYNRGELFFSKYWLLVEGETEHIFFESLLNHDGFLDKNGIRIIQYSQIGAGTILKIANDIYIRWYIVTDGDIQGLENREKARQLLPVNKNDSELIFSFNESSIEVYLMNNGFESFYYSRISPQIKKNITESETSPNYNNAVYEAIKKSITKPEVVLEIVDNINSKKIIDPPVISYIKQKLINIIKIKDTI